MPLLLVTGPPASGKSTIVSRILHAFQSKDSHQVEAVHIRDEDNPSYSSSDYGDPKKEKENRGILRSAVQRSVSKDVLVVCDSLNYIKGFRYELYCTGKNVQTTFAVLHCNAGQESCLFFNSQRAEGKLRYSDSLVVDLIKRYEAPNSSHRWDSPLLTVCISHQDDLSTPRAVALPTEELYSLLFEGKPLKANVSTQSLMPCSPATFLSELNTTTQMVIDALLEQQRTAVPGDKLAVMPGALSSTSKSSARVEEGRIDFTRQRSTYELNRIRSQFIHYLKSHPIEDSTKTALLFIDFINANP